METKTALIIVDEQNDFCEGGALAVSGGLQAVATTNALLEAHGSSYALIVASRDWHEEGSTNGEHFAEVPDFVDTWPAHCVQGTYGAQYADSLEVSYIQEHVVKGMGIPAYSAFEGVRQGSRTALHEVLQEHGITSVEVVGIATDYCVKATALDALKLGYSTSVLEPCTAAVGSQEEAVNALEDAGCLVRSQGL